MAQKSYSEWLGHVRRWKDSGLSARKYAQQEGLCASTLYNWSAKLSSEQEAQTADVKPRRPTTGSSRKALAERPPAPSTASFVEIAPMAAGAAVTGIEVAIGDLVRLRIPNGVDEQTLALVVRALGVGQ